MTKVFVTGWPISHALSPALHGFWMRRHKIDGSYEALAVKPKDFPAFLQALPGSGFVGGNVTIPHKQAAFALCPHHDRDAATIGSVNTLWLENGELHGGCTDAYGFAANLDDQVPQWKSSLSALVLGAGGASRAIVHALKAAGIARISVVNRTLERAKQLATAFGKPVSAYGWADLPEALNQADLIINTTSLGMGGLQEILIDLSPASPRAIVADIVYSPLATALLNQAKKRGLVTADGLGMLLHQAVPGFEKWFGVRPVVDAELRHHMLSVLAARNPD